MTIQWRPFLLGPIFKSFGWTTSPFVVQTWKTEYVWKDMERECLHPICVGVGLLIGAKALSEARERERSRNAAP